jgi:hypothetical protein
LIPGTKAQVTAPRPGEEAGRVKELDMNTHSMKALLKSARCLGERGFGLLTQR